MQWQQPWYLIPSSLAVLPIIRLRMHGLPEDKVLTALHRRLTRGESVDVRVEIRHDVAPMARMFTAETLLQGRTLSSFGAHVCQPADSSDTRRGRSVGTLARTGNPDETLVARSIRAAAHQRSSPPSTACTTVMRASLILRSSHGGVAVSNTDDRRFDSFRACAHRTTSPGTSSLTTAEASSPGTASPRSRNGSVAPVARRPTHTCASRLTGGAPGSYPGTDWVRVPGRVPSRRSSAARAPARHSRRSRVRIPSVARSST